MARATLRPLPGESSMHWSPGCEPRLVAAATAAALAYPDRGITVQDAAGHVVAVNEASPAILGLTVDQMLGRTSMDPRWSAVSESGLPLTGEEHPPMVSLREGVPVRDFLMGVMAPIDAGELGHTLGRTRWVMANSDPVLALPSAGGSDGGVIGVVTTFFDAGSTERGRRAGDRQSAAFQLVVQNAEDVIVRTDAAGSIVWVSVSVDREMGWRPGDLVGALLVDLIHPDDRDAVGDRPIDDDLAPTGRAPRIEFRMRQADGSWKWVSDAVRRVHDAELRGAGELHAIRDIDREMGARQALAQSEERFRLIAENALDLIVHVRDARVAWASPSAEAMLTDACGDLAGRPVVDLLHSDDESRYAAAVTTVTSGVSAVVRVRLRFGDGDHHWVEAHLRPYGTATTTAAEYILAGRLADDLVRAEAALERQARFDALTGLLNRGEAFGVMSRLLVQERRHGEGVAALFCDVDHFKTINDSFGHAAGDAVLRALAVRIQALIRAQDVAARLGGDELLVILVGVRDAAAALALAERIARAATTPITSAAGDISTTVSIGIALARRGGSVDDLVERADTALYEAKRQGRARVVLAPTDVGA